MKNHRDAMIATESFLNSVENPKQNVNNRIHDEKRKNIIRNRHIVKCASEVLPVWKFSMGFYLKHFHTISLSRFKYYVS